MDIGSPAKGLGLSLQHSTPATNKDIPPTSPAMILKPTCSSSSDDGVFPISSPEVKVCLNVDSYTDNDSPNNETSNKVSIVIINSKHKVNEASFCPFRPLSCLKAFQPL